MPTATRKRTAADYPEDPLAIRAGELAQRWEEWHAAIRAALPAQEQLGALIEQRDDLRKFADRPSADADPARLVEAGGAVQVLGRRIADLTPAANRLVDGQEEARRRYFAACVRYRRLLADLRAEERGAGMLTDKQRDELHAELDRLAGLED